MENAQTPSDSLVVCWRWQFIKEKSSVVTNGCITLGRW